MTPEEGIEKVKELKAIIHSKRVDCIFEASEFILKSFAKEVPTKLDLTDKQAKQLILNFVLSLLDAGRYIEAAGILWGDDIFSAEPESVKLIWTQLPTCSELLIMGASAMGKSFSVAVWILLDWIRDPANTCVKVLSLTQEHALRNVFAHIKNLHDCSIVPLPGSRKTGSIQVDDNDKQGIHLTTIPQGDEGKGRLRGFHPSFRRENHPKFGNLTRIRAILDEAEEIPQGVWEDINNILATKKGNEHIKIVAASNPKDRLSKFGLLCGPKDGWGALDIETSIQWENKFGWSIIRLDGARCENVIQQKIVYEGLITYEGYSHYLLRGDNDPEMWTMARGMFPPDGIAMSVIPITFMDRAVGQFIFTGVSTYCASVDFAFQGSDRTVMTVGKWGKVTAYHERDGSVIKFDEARYGLQIDAQFELKKQMDSTLTVDEIISTCLGLGIKGAWLICDKTGPGTTAFDLLNLKMGGEVTGLDFGTNATDKKVLEDDSEIASSMYDGVVTELLFATRKYIEFHYLKFGPSLDINEVAPELTNRRFRQVGKGKVRIEGKREYKSRNGGKSCDYADSLTMLVHLVRLRSDFTAAMIEMTSEREIKPKIGIVDNLQFQTWEDNNE